ncbi:ABC transporter permease [Meridianimarinicoccus roseus]|uniref:ABC transporter permease n=1 Tax=Meridianimarinicoccus roseus TaxID=2072018 RepID=A0A2V2LK33_9RHOB|nr:ABC transporter permease [Meridianimarinicoccus roseus]PWR02679.1 ABC transporter permease [Meridianimarinicoccus roseus]
MRFERRARTSPLLGLAAPLVAVAVALTIAGGLIALSGAPVLEAYARIAAGAFGSRLAITETLTRATPLILTGLAAAVAFRAQVWNIGAEGQLYAGALAVAALGAANPLGLPPAALIAALMLSGALAGMMLLVIPVVLRLRFGVDEVVTTLLGNFIVLLFVSLAVEGFLKDPLAFGWPQSVPVVEEAALPRIVERSRLHLGLAIACALAGLVFLIGRHTVFGMQSRAAGLNPAAARFAGVPIPGTLIRVACLSGGLAGLAGAVEVLGVKGYVTTDLSPGFGYSGIVVAMLAGLNPLGVVLAAVFVAAMFVGADGMSRTLDVPSFIADVTVALSLLTMLVALFFTAYRVRR